MLKKVLLLALVLTSYLGYNQIDEDFESGIPSNWTQYQTYDDDDGFEITGTEAHSGSQSAYHYFGYLTETGDSDSWLVTDAQTITLGTNEFLSFWYRQGDTGSYYNFSGVYISTGSNDPMANPGDFTLLQEFDATFGYSEDEWTKYTNDLSSYAGQTVYIAFKYVGNGSHIFYIDDVKLIASPTCVNPTATYEVVSDCDNGQQFLVDVTITDLGGDDDVEISDNQGNTQTVSTTGTYTFGPYANGTSVQVTIENTSDGSCSTTSGNLIQNFCPEQTVNCSGPPVNTVFCYENDDNIDIEYTASTTSSLNLVVNSGEISTSAGDSFLVIDSNGNELYNGNGNNGDLSGLSFDSTGDNITVQLQADDNISCQSEGYAPIDLTVSCLGCVIPQATYTTVPDCDNGQQFLIDVDLTDLGSATDVDISDDQGNTQTVSTTDTYTFGPYANGTPVVISVTNNQNGACSVSSQTLTEDYCSELTVHCDEGPLTSNFCYTDNETIEITYTSSDPNGVLNLNVNSGEVENNYDEFIVLDSDDSEIYNDYGNGGDLSGLSFQSNGASITVQVQADGSNDCNDGDEAPIDLTVSCATCINPDVDFSVVSDCPNGNAQFFVAADITDMGSASSLTVTDNVNGPPQTVTSPGTVTFGPYPFQAGIVLTVQNDDDSSCSISSNELTQNLCAITTDTDLYTVEELVTDILIDTPCAQISNITSSTGTDFGSTNGIGYFTDGGSDFPIESGLILNTGDVNNAPGPHTGPSDGAFDWPGDTDLENAIPDLASGDSNNATIIEFDFVPFTDHISFNFLFASDEYGTFQCSYSDAFAFLLTDQNSNNTTNLAVLPDGTTPIAVTTIRDQTYNGSCSSLNEEYFDKYYGTPNGLPEDTDPTNYHGQTVPLSAESDVTPGQAYHIKLVIADRGDTAFDSAVFLEAGSFDIGEIDLGPDLTPSDENAPCDGETITLDSGIENTTGAMITWYNGNTLISDETGTTLDVTESGLYTVSVIYFQTCALDDTIDVEFAPNPEIDLNPNSSICVGSETTLDGTPTNLPDLANGLTYQWFLNGTEIPNETNSTLLVDEIGTYKVVVTTANGCTGEDTVEVTDSSFTVSLGDDQTFCDQDSYDLTATLTDGDPSNATFEWTGPNGAIAETTQTITVSESGTYTVMVDIGDCTASDSVELDFNASPEFDLGNDIVTADLNGIVLDATPTNIDPDTATYEWNYNGNPIPENGPMVNPSDYGFGTYTVTIYGDDPDCDATQSITITEEDINCDVTIETDKQLVNSFQYCENDGDIPKYKITFTATFNSEVAPNGEVEYTWFKNGNELPNVTGSTYTMTYDSEGDFTDDFTVQADAGNCSVSASVSTDISIVPYDHPCEISQGLSPGNNDGINDCLDLTFVSNRSGIVKFMLFNRYGVKVYEKKDYVNTWCGQDDDGDDLQTGTYYYILEMKNEDPIFGKTKRGWIYINRKSN